MKRFSFFLAGFMLTLSLSAQQETPKSTGELRTIFGKSNEPMVGWFIGIEQGYTQFDNRDVWTGGLNFGMTIDHQLSLGFGGHTWCNRNDNYYPEITDTAGAYLEGGYGGLLVEYTIFPKSPVHLTFPVLIGGGGASYVSENEYTVWDEDEWDTEHHIIDEDLFFVVEPGVKVEFNLLRFMRLNAGVSYRYVDGLQMVNTSEDLMNNFNCTVGLKFGKF